MTAGKIRIAVVGLGNFGQTWAAAYAALPDVAHVGICEPDERLLNTVGNKLGIERRHGDLASVLAEAEAGVLPDGQRGRKVSVKRMDLPPMADLVPDAIVEVVRTSRIRRQTGIPMAHEFVRSIVEHRPPAVDVFTAANWTAAGVCAHESAMCNGERVAVPYCE